MKIVLLVFLAIGIFVALIFLSTFLRMAFIADITEFKLRSAIEVDPLLDGVVITEISKDESPWPHQWEHDLSTGDVTAAAEMVLFDNGELSEEPRAFDESPGTEVLVLGADVSRPGLIFNGNQIYKVEHGKLGSEYGSFPDFEAFTIPYASPLNADSFLIAGYPADTLREHLILYQVNSASLKKTQIASDLYYCFLRPPMVFQPKGLDSVIVVYYVGSLNYGFGGDASRPEFSHIRIYNKKFPQGLEIAKFGLKAGTIVDIKSDAHHLTVTGDPSRPAAASQEPKPARIWKIELPDGVLM